MIFNAIFFPRSIHSIHYLQSETKTKHTLHILSTLLLGKIILAEILPCMKASDKAEAAGHFWGRFLKEAGEGTGAHSMARHAPALPRGLCVEQPWPPIPKMSTALKSTAGCLSLSRHPRHSFPTQLMSQTSEFKHHSKGPSPVLRVTPICRTSSAKVIFKQAFWWKTACVSGERNLHFTFSQIHATGKLN